mmetsp:Transcript_9754/g.23710  ORF Transcript_9754/g.23710 Transcript_9754/m.23710 type:complete len:200 (-) Transcript_9754:87-686(-)|eukprot:5869972-Prymnesium_polylepis.2
MSWTRGTVRLSRAHGSCRSTMARHACTTWAGSPPARQPRTVGVPSRTAAVAQPCVVWDYHRTCALDVSPESPATRFACAGRRMACRPSARRRAMGRTGSTGGVSVDSRSCEAVSWRTCRPDKAAILWYDCARGAVPSCLSLGLCPLAHARPVTLPLYFAVTLSLLCRETGYFAVTLPAPHTTRARPRGERSNDSRLSKL